MREHPEHGTLISPDWSRFPDKTRDHENQQQDSNLSLAVLEATPDGVITVDEDLIVRALNLAAAEMFGYQFDRVSEELARTKDCLQQLAHVASHDLQEPLRMVGSYCELLERRYADTLDDKAKQFLHFAVDGALRMKILIEGMLNFSRIETEARPPSMVESCEIANEVIHRLSGTITRADAEINLGPLPRVFADEAQLDEVLFQLLSNALKFRKPDDQLSVDVTAEDSDNEWIFTVRDNGLGLDPEQSDKIFGLFQRVANGDHHEGIGLGLGLCKRIVERHRGCIWVRSEPGFGSAFYFALPKPASGAIQEAADVGERSTSASTLLDEVLGKPN